MSEIYKYESDLLQSIIKVRLSDDEAAVAGAEPAGAISPSITAYASGSRKRNGIHTRGVVCTRTIGTAGDTAKKRTFVTMLTPAAYNAISEKDDITIGGIAWKVSKKVPETIV